MPSFASRLLSRSALLAVAATLASCGGSGGSGVSSAPPPPPSPTTPGTALTPPPPGTNFATAEYQGSGGAVQANAISAYERGASGAGVTLAIIDSGIDTRSAEFAGRIAPASQSVAGNTTIQDEDGHGTAVSAVALAAKDNSRMHGVAWNATLLALRTDDPGSCASTDGCAFDDRSIARGIDAAVANGAAVINISLGGGAASQGTIDAARRAVAAGRLIVVAAGNKESSTTDAELANPEIFAMNLSDAGKGGVIIAGSVGTTHEISSFSYRAGSYGAFYLTALGERLVAPGNDGTYYQWSGTSFASPVIAGGAALLKQAFPHLTGAQIAEILFTSAADRGALGTDAIYGRGEMDLARAFQPIGKASVAGSREAIDLHAVGTLSSAMGDAGARGTAGGIILDGYSRAFAVDFARRLSAAPMATRLYGAVAARPRVVSLGAGKTAIRFALTPAPEHGVLDAAGRLARPDAAGPDARRTQMTLVQPMGKRGTAAFGYHLAADVLTDEVAAADRGGFLIAGDPRTLAGQGFAPEGALAWRMPLNGALSLTGFGESGLVEAQWADPRARLLAERDRDARDARYTRVGASLDWTRGATRVDASLGVVDEARTLLGARLVAPFAVDGATSVTAGLGARQALGDGWSLGGRYQLLLTRARGLGEGSAALRSAAFAIDAEKRGLLVEDDYMGLRLAQPVRVAAGGVQRLLPVDYDHASATPTLASMRLGLAPEGRQLDAEWTYARPIGGGWFAASAFHVREPGNIAAARSDTGLLARYTLGF